MKINDNEFYIPDEMKKWYFDFKDDGVRVISSNDEYFYAPQIPYQFNSAGLILLKCGARLGEVSSWKEASKYILEYEKKKYFE